MGLMDNFRRFMQGGQLDVRDRFELEREAIYGTMSKFYMVRDRTTGAEYGLKILDRAKTAAFESRFAGLDKPSEGEVASKLDHPRVVKTYEYGQTTKGEHFLLMEFIHGSGLNALVRMADPVMVENRLVLIRHLAEAVQVVHDAGYIHRDICPRNFICAEDVQSAKLIDFGLTVPDEREFTQPGNRTGTPNYMAPEIIRRRPTDQRLDLFALGVTSFQMLALELPWPSLDATGKAAVLHDTREPTDILELCPDLNRKLAELIHQCMAKQPSDRPSAEQCVRELSRITSEKEE
jgi:serine/threonine protein kinase